MCSSISNPKVKKEELPDNLEVLMAFQTNLDTSSAYSFMLSIAVLIIADK